MVKRNVKGTGRKGKGYVQLVKLVPGKKKPQLFSWHNYELVTPYGTLKIGESCAFIHVREHAPLSGHERARPMTETGFPTLFPPLLPPHPLGTYLRAGGLTWRSRQPSNAYSVQLPRCSRERERRGEDHFHLRRRSRKDTIYTKEGRQQEADRDGVGELQKSLSTNSMGMDGSFHKISFIPFLCKSRLENEASPVPTTTSMELSITQPKYTLFFPLRLLVGDACGGCAMRWSGEGGGDADEILSSSQPSRAGLRQMKKIAMPEVR